MLWYNKCENLYKESANNFSYNTGTQLETTVTFTQGKVISNWMQHMEHYLQLRLILTYL